MGTPALKLERETRATLKGTSFVNVRHFVTTKFGIEMWEKVLDSLNSQERDVVRSAAAVGWYDSSTFGRLLRAVDATCGRGDLAFLNEVGAYEAEQDFGRAIRIFLRVVEPMSLFKIQSRLWRHFQSSGELELIPAQGGMDTVLTGWVADNAQCIELGGYLVRAIEFAGGKSVSVTHPECRGRGDARCLFQHRWK